jgi:hypothetical protein
VASSKRAATDEVSRQVVLDPRGIIAGLHARRFLERKVVFTASRRLQRELAEAEREVSATELAERRAADQAVAAEFVKGLTMCVEYFHTRCWDLTYVFPYSRGPTHPQLKALAHAHPQLQADLRPSPAVALRPLTAAETSVLLLGGLSTAHEVIMPALRPLIEVGVPSARVTKLEVFTGWDKDRFLGYVPTMVEVVQRAVAQQVDSAAAAQQSLHADDLAHLLRHSRFDNTAVSFRVDTPAGSGSTSSSAGAARGDLPLRMCPPPSVVVSRYTAAAAGETSPTRAFSTLAHQCSQRLATLRNARPAAGLWSWSFGSVSSVSTVPTARPMLSASSLSSASPRAPVHIPSAGWRSAAVHAVRVLGRILR